MTVLEHAKIYLDLPKEMQDDDAAEFARTVLSQDRLLDEWRRRWLAWKNWAEGHAPPSMQPAGLEFDQETRREIDALIEGLRKRVSPPLRLAARLVIMAWDRAREGKPTDLISNMSSSISAMREVIGDDEPATKEVASDDPRCNSCEGPLTCKSCGWGA